MKQLNFVVTVVCSLFVGFLFGFFAPEKSNSFDRGLVSFSEVSTTSLQPAMDYAFSADRAVVFIDYEWSPNSKVALLRFNAFVESTLERGELKDIDFCVLNMTDVTDEQLARFPNVFHGNGEVVWINKGQVVQEALLLEDIFSCEEFVSSTKSAFSVPVVASR